MKLAAAGLLFGILAVVAATVAPRVSRSSLVSLEKLADSKVIQLDANTPAEALGPTRGVYLEGYGAVFTAEVDPNPYAAPNPFSRPRYTEVELDKLRTQKLASHRDSQKAHDRIARRNGARSRRCSAQ
jgi:hypothetical protein